MKWNKLILIPISCPKIRRTARHKGAYPKVYQYCFFSYSGGRVIRRWSCSARVREEEMSSSLRAKNRTVIECDCKKFSISRANVKSQLHHSHTVWIHQIWERMRYELERCTHLLLHGTYYELMVKRIIAAVRVDTVVPCYHVHTSM